MNNLQTYEKLWGNKKSKEQNPNSLNTNVNDVVSTAKPVEPIEQIEDIKNYDDDFVYEIINTFENKGINTQNLKYEYKYNRYPLTRVKDFSDVEIYFYRITKKKKLNLLDPYGEEEWEEEGPNQMTIKITKSEDYSKIEIDNIELDVSKKAYMKMWNYFQNAENIEHKRIQDEKERIRRGKIVATRKSFIDLTEKRIINIMNNLQTYEQYLNEGLFSSKYKDIVEKIYNYIKKIDLEDVVITNNRSYPDYTIIISKNSETKENDPYDEEVYEEDIIVRLEKSYSCGDFRNYDYELYINDEKIDVYNSEARKLYIYIENKIEDKKSKEKIERIKETERKIKAAFDNL